jgi:tetratricopeptide (TPR) repeat protein
MEILATYETFQLYLSAYFRGTTLNMQESTLRYRSARTWLFCLYFSGTMFESQQPFKNTAAIERLTSPAKFANALNYSRSLRLTLDKEHTKAIADYTKSIELDPKSASVYSARGYVYYYEKEYELAFADFSKAIELDPKYALAYFYRGSAYNNKKEYDKAIADLTKSIELDSKNALAYNARGFAYSYKKEYNSAIADYTRSIELDPKHVLAYYNRAYAYEAKGEKILADKDRQKAKELEGQPK